MPTHLDDETAAATTGEDSPTQVADAVTDAATQAEPDVVAGGADAVPADDAVAGEAPFEAPVEAAVEAAPVVPSEPDAVCAAAVELARAAAVDISGDAAVIGDHLGLDVEGERVVTHYFASKAKGYHGWRWAVTVARAPRLRTATVSEVVLLPGAEAVLAPTWLPWSDRLAPGDLGPADQLPYRADDPYLEPGYQQSDDEEADQVALWELGLGRARVLSPLGRSSAAERWYLGDRGPTSDEAVHASAACASCGYFVALSGALRRVFGVCANEWSPSDGRVVSVDHGCGAHSETDVERPEPLPLPEPILDETGAVAVVLPPKSVPSEAVASEEVAPVDEVPSDEAPAMETAEEAPVAEAVVDEIPAAEAVVDEAPVEETPEAEAIAVAVLEVAEGEAKAAAEATPEPVEEPGDPTAS